MIKEAEMCPFGDEDTVGESLQCLNSGDTCCKTSSAPCVVRRAAYEAPGAPFGGYRAVVTSLKNG
jgi:hypothetical protein